MSEEEKEKEKPVTPTQTIPDPVPAVQTFPSISTTPDVMSAGIIRGPEYKGNTADTLSPSLNERSNIFN
jgi:hypothetical protein